VIHLLGWEVHALELPHGVTRRVQRAGYAAREDLTYRRGFAVRVMGFLVIVCRSPRGQL